MEGEGQIQLTGNSNCSNLGSLVVEEEEGVEAPENIHIQMRTPEKRAILTEVLN